MFRITRVAATAALGVLCCALAQQAVCTETSAAERESRTVVAPAAAGASAPAPIVRLEDFALLALSASEGIAVLRAPDKRLVTLRVGSTLPEARARLLAVQADGLRFETVDDQGVSQTARMVRSGLGDASRVQRLSVTPPPKPAISSRSEATLSPLPTARSPESR